MKIKIATSFIKLFYITSFISCSDNESNLGSSNMQDEDGNIIQILSNSRTLLTNSHLQNEPDSLNSLNSTSSSLNDQLTTDYPQLRSIPFPIIKINNTNFKNFNDKMSLSNETTAQKAPKFEIQFDTSDHILLAIFKDFSSKIKPTGYNSFGFFVDPETNSPFFIKFPIYLAIPKFEKNENIFRRCVEKEETISDEFQNSNECKNLIESKTTSQIFTTPPRLRVISLSSTSSPLLASQYFTLKMNEIEGIPEVHTDFPAQDILFVHISEFKNSVKLENIHLRAFELAPDLLFELVKRCPTMYYWPVLALSLQYDQDFTKFIKFFYIDNFRILHKERQAFLLKIFLHQPTVSQNAFRFFIDSTNAPFFFSDLDSYPSYYYGKFSPNILAVELASFKTYHNDSISYFSNPLRSWILNFDYLKYLKTIFSIESLSKLHLNTIFKTINLFKNKNELAFYVYKLMFSSKKFPALRILYRHKFFRQVLRQALLFEDYFTIKYLFTHMELEKTDGLVTFRSQINPVDIELSSPTSRTLLVKISTKDYAVKVILPLK